MKKKKLLDHEVIDIFEIYRNFKSNYLKVIFIFFSCLIISLLYAQFQSKKTQFVESKIVIRKPMITAFQSIDNFFIEKYFYNQDSLIVSDYFFNNLTINLSSKKLLTKFISKYEKLIELKKNNKNFINYLKINKSNKLDLRGRIIRDPIEYSFIYTRSEKFDGNKFLNDFTNFVYKKTLNVFINEVKDSINLEIVKYKEHLNYAIELNIEEPKNIFSSDKTFESKEFLLGYKFLLLKINNLKKKLNTLNHENIKYEPVYEEATIISNNENYFPRYVFIGLIVGFCISFLLILFVTLKKKYNNE